MNGARQRTIYVGGLVCMMSLTWLSGSALAEGLSIQQFEPAPGGVQNFANVQGAGSLEQLTGTFGIFVNEAYRPLVMSARDGSGSIDLIRHQVQSDLLVAIGLRKSLQLGFAMPITLYQAPGEDVDSSSSYAALPSTALGDLRIIPKWSLLGPEARLGAAFQATVKLPTGDSSAYQGNGTFAIEPRAIVDYKLLPTLRIGTNLGYLARASQALGSLELGDELLYGAGAAYTVNPTVQVVGELFGRIGIESLSALADAPETRASAQYPFEYNLGARWEVATGHLLSLGAGGGVGSGYGTPTFRAYAGYSFAGRLSSAHFDPDRDGLRGARDACPHEAEDRDGFQDDDGCPDPDNDADGLPDLSDLCPAAAEDLDGFEDSDGCPELDNDRDQLPDQSDQCPNQAEDRDGFADDDGCPDPDDDGDGIPDDADRCPNVPETRNGLMDDDGCPEADRDLDGVVDDVDRCPDLPEHPNGVSDEDGCPEADSDGDGVDDLNDRCPQEPEDREGIDDQDGCPDGHGTTTATHFSSESIPLSILLFFGEGDSSLDARSIQQLDRIAQWMSGHARVKVRLIGFTDTQGAETTHAGLSMRRALAARQYLMQQGISTRRIQVRALGQRWPAASNETEAGRARNRRVRVLPIGPGGKAMENLPPELAVPLPELDH